MWKTKRLDEEIPAGRMTRRALFGTAASTAATLVVSQVVAGCGSDVVGSDEDDDDDGSASCVLTAALTEGPYFVDERLNRSDIRSDPVTGTISQGVQLGLTFAVSCAAIRLRTRRVLHASRPSTRAGTLAAPSTCISSCA